MAWIESHQEIGRHPKTKRLARELGISVPTVVGHLHLLWHWCFDFAEDGDLSQYSWDDIADAAMWEGNPTVFGMALVSCGWLDTDDEADDPEHSIHDWDDYTGRLQNARESYREANRERQRRWRERHRNDTDNVTPSFNTEDNALPNVTVTQSNGPTVPNRNLTVTKPNQTKPEEEPTRARATAAPVANQAYATFVDGCLLLDADPADIKGTARSKQLAAIKATLQDNSPDDVLGCLRWLLSDDWRRERGVDFLTVRDNIGKWVMTGRSTAVSARASPNGTQTKHQPDFSGLTEFNEAMDRRTPT